MYLYLFVDTQHPLHGSVYSLGSCNTKLNSMNFVIRIVGRLVKMNAWNQSFVCHHLVFYLLNLQFISFKFVIHFNRQQAH